jgi:hypothetical protein
LRFAAGLRRAAAEAGDEDEGPGGSRFEPGAGGLGGEGEDGLVEADLRLADGELRRVHADGEAAGAGVGVVADDGRWRRSSQRRARVRASGRAG